MTEPECTDGVRRIAYAVYDHCNMDDATQQAAFGVATYTVAQLLHCSIKAAALMMAQWLTEREKCCKR